MTKSRNHKFGQTLGTIFEPTIIVRYLIDHFSRRSISTLCLKVIYISNKLLFIEIFVTKANLMLDSNVGELMTSSRFNRNDWNSEFPKHFVVYAFEHWFAVEPDLQFDSYRNTHLMWYCSTNCDLIRVIYSFVYTVLCIRFES